jgi:hypothetical protein
LFREQHSNLWFIRSSKAINENGFFVALNRYETQVFLDIYEVQDDARGRWARLHHDLQRRPVSDPHSAIKDLFLGDLYYRFTKPLKEEIINRLHGFFAKKQKPAELQSFIESLKEPAEKYFTTVTHFIGGADGKFDPWKAEEIDVNQKFQAVNTKQLWDEFRGYVERLAGLSAYLNTAGKTPGERLLKELAKRLKESKLLCAAALGYGLLAILRSIIGKGADGSLAANLAFEHWELDRKLKEQFRVFGANDDEVWRIGEISRAVLRRTTLRQTTDYTGKFDPGLFATTIIGRNYLNDDFRLLIGLNRFNDVTWFNKEAFESALFYGKLFYVLEGDSAFISGESAGKDKTLPWLERVERIAKIAEALEKAEAGSGFQLDILIQLLTAKEKTSKSKKSAPKTGKETAKPKTSAPKTSKPKAAKPETAKPKTAEPKAAKGKTAKPKTVTPKTAKPKASTPKASKPKAAKPKTVKPKTSTPKTVKPKASTPKTSAPKTSKEKASKPKKSDPKPKTGKRKGKE